MLYETHRSTMMNILVSNDDGIESLGIRTLAQYLKQLGEVWVVAPERPQDAMGRAITLHKPLRLHRIGPASLLREWNPIGLCYVGGGTTPQGSVDTFTGIRD